MDTKLSPDFAEKLNTSNLFNNIKKTVLKIEEELLHINKTGVFFAPELYIAFCVGKDIMQNQQQIFNTTNVKWCREIDLNNGGITDIMFEIGNKQIVIEVKIRDDIHSYKRDIEKLNRLKTNSQKFFCVLLDSFAETNDKRLIELENFYGNSISKIGQHAFPTWDVIYKKQIFCNLNLYLIV